MLNWMLCVLPPPRAGWASGSMRLRQTNGDTQERVREVLGHSTGGSSAEKCNNHFVFSRVGSRRPGWACGSSLLRQSSGQVCAVWARVWWCGSAHLAFIVVDFGRWRRGQARLGEREVAQIAQAIGTGERAGGAGGGGDGGWCPPLHEGLARGRAGRILRHRVGGGRGRRAPARAIMYARGAGEPTSTCHFHPTSSWRLEWAR